VGIQRLVLVVMYVYQPVLVQVIMEAHYKSPQVIAHQRMGVVVGWF
jgi:hypothetical protein